MIEDRNNSFNKVEQFVLRLALLALLVIGLLKVIIPEIKSLTTYFSGKQEATVLEHQPASGTNTNLSPKH
jgi:uncharacterized membrane protein